MNPFQRGGKVSVPACSHLDSMPGAAKKENDVECIFNNKKRKANRENSPEGG